MNIIKDLAIKIIILTRRAFTVLAMLSSFRQIAQRNIYTHIYFSANIVAAYNPCMLSLPSLSLFFSLEGGKNKRLVALGTTTCGRPCTEIKRKRPRGVDAFIIRCFNLSDSSHPVTVAGAN